MLSFFFAHAVILEAMAIAIVLTIAFATQKHSNIWFRTAERGLGWIGRRQTLAVTLVGILALGGSAILTLRGRIPVPTVHDEFSYLLAADTFARGRLTNPTHPLWVHFETFHIIQQPSYASKYPPAQGMMLAAGQVIGGHPIVGVWISTALACAAICWMLLAWFPPWWAMLGSLLVALHPGILLQWGQSYWGGIVAMMGGGLVFGALRRIVRRPSVCDATLLGAGLAVLANSRPYEGLLASLPVGVVLLVWMTGKNGPAVQVSIKRIVLPISLVLALTGGAMGFYNWRVTGDVLRMPYQVHEATYAMAPALLWQHPQPEPEYRHKVLRDYHVGRYLKEYTAQSSVHGLVWAISWKLERLWIFYLGLHQPSHRLRLSLTVPLIMLPWVLKNRWLRFVLLTCGLLVVGLLLEVWMFPHYSAPITGLVFVLLLQAMRHLRLWRWHGRPTGRLLMWTFSVVALASFAVAFGWKMQVPSSGWPVHRAHILTQLKEHEGHHLVIVRYGPSQTPHYEWVYNGADIDDAKVVWARDMDMAQNRQLFEYFKDRHVWLMEVEGNHFPTQLSPYPVKSRP
jgi:hypothetical protein